MSTTRVVIYAVGREVLPGPYATEPPDSFDDRIAFYKTAAFACPLSKHEAEAILRCRVVLHGTYSLQQGDFARAGFAVSSRPWKVMLPDDALVVCIGTRDRYDIFGTAPEVHQYESVDEWRGGRIAAAEGWE
jgi:hypothetical protein